MTNTRTHVVYLERIYSTEPDVIYNLFKNGSVFRLTRADEIKSDFEVGKPFSLTFKNRGTINGQFIKISNEKIVIEWNVFGFERPDELKTLVEITLGKVDGNCILTLEHSNIVQEESALAKQKAWSEILVDIENVINK